VILFTWAVLQKERVPKAREWASALALGFLIFLVDYGLLFWAQQRVPSGLAAVMMATIPAFMALSEIILLRTQRLTIRLVSALLIGFVGVAVLMNPSMNIGGATIDTRGAVALIFASMSWGVASALTRMLPLPASKAMSSGSQMIAGGVLLAATAFALGEHTAFQPTAVSSRAWLSLMYLIAAGSLIGFTAYVWLIHHESPTKVATYAYVNPVVAVVIGYFLGNEIIDVRTTVGTFLILISVVVITTIRRPKTA
jgi:drug/metabolite transporter (DMT)-like permease